MMQHLHFYQTDDFDVQSRWEITRGNVTYHYNCDSRTPLVTEVHAAYNRLFRAIGIEPPVSHEYTMAWGYDE
jgi:hypothetical protein